jgi:hypothetical protein
MVYCVGVDITLFFAYTVHFYLDRVRWPDQGIAHFSTFNVHKHQVILEGSDRCVGWRTPTHFCGGALLCHHTLRSSSTIISEQDKKFVFVVYEVHATKLLCDECKKCLRAQWPKGLKTSLSARSQTGLLLYLTLEFALSIF